MALIFLTTNILAWDARPNPKMKSTIYQQPRARGGHPNSCLLVITLTIHYLLVSLLHSFSCSIVRASMIQERFRVVFLFGILWLLRLGHGSVSPFNETYSFQSRKYGKIHCNRGSIKIHGFLKKRVEFSGMWQARGKPDDGGIALFSDNS